MRRFLFFLGGNEDNVDDNESSDPSPPPQAEGQSRIESKMNNDYNCYKPVNQLLFSHFQSYWANTG